MFYVTKFGKELDPSKYIWDNERRILYVSGWYITVKAILADNITFISDDMCNFEVGDNNIFYTGHSCAFKTGHGCIFNTRYGCNFHTKWNSIFNIEDSAQLRYIDNEFLLNENLTITSPDGTLQLAKDIIVEDIKINDLNKNEIQIIINNKFYYTENKSFLPVLEAFKNKNDTEFLMRETDSRLYRHLLKTFKMN